jgi:hypothetical protein
LHHRTLEQVAWAAGLFEGEGCWNAYVREGGTVQMQARLGMTDRDVVERFAAVIGFGAIHQAQPGTGGWKPLHTWCVYEAEKVREVIALFMPYMGERRRAKAEEVLAAGANVQVANGERTHCPSGHPYEGDNLVIEMRGTQPVRRCKTCDNRRSPRP